MMDRYLVPELLRVHKEENPEYPLSELDARPALKIATFIYEQLKLDRGPENHAYAILEIWRPMSRWIAADQWYRQKSLNTISNHIAEVFQKCNYGDKSKQGAKLSGSKLKDAIAKRYSK